MLSAADWTAMAADLALVRGDNATSIVIRRGATTLAAQSVRVAGLGGGAGPVAGSNRAGEYRGPVMVQGGTTLNIAPEDRFTVAGVLYRVTFVSPNRRAAVVAKAEMVE